MISEDRDLADALDQNKPILCVRFDGVIHEYNANWRLMSTVILGAPLKGAFNFLGNAHDHFCVCVVGERNTASMSRRSMFRWFKTHGWPFEDNRPAFLLFPRRQPECFISIDDRCLRFEGAWPDITELSKFKAWQEATDGKPS